MAETIFAPASGPGPAGIAVIRLSGPATAAAIGALTGRGPPPPRRASLRRLAEPATGRLLDQALVLWFPAPQSFTGEAMAELQLHGGRAVVAAVLAALAGLPGLRPAAPGEFSRRAVMNGRLDLTAAEGLADLVAAETEMQRRQALRQLEGALGRLYGGWAERLTRLLAHAEAAIDFADEELPADLEQNRNMALAALCAEIDAHLADGHRGERLRGGFAIAVIGPPNAGKSSLLNALARRDAAIVAAIPGTTRDVVEVQLDLGGFPVTLADTAGLRDSADPVEAEGVRRARARAASADLRIAVLDAGTWPDLDARTVALVDGDTVVVLNKTDLAGLPPVARIAGRAVWPLSLATGDGLPALTAHLAACVAERIGLTEAPSLTRARHRATLAACRAALARAADAALPELAAEDLRLAVRELGRLTGRVDVEDLLDRIFAEFCIGK
ncbi:MAG: tRNA uridine-5-carboxymethylaminomethyl(34) synthesis GTPase MnmE [Dongiaceae bacterium]